MTNKPMMHVFMLVKTTPEWLALTPDERFAMLDRYVRPILSEHSGKLDFRFFDIEFFAARVTDLWLWEVKDLDAYRAAIESLRETPVWDRWFEIVEILPGVENAYAEHYGREPLAA
jgi:hypothetical protein